MARGVHDKLVARHPHVFGDVSAETADEVVANWEQIKKAEKGRASVFDGRARRPAGPAVRPQGPEEGGLARARPVGVEPAPDRVGPDAGEMSDADFAQGLGELLWGVVDRARRLGVDPEDALRAATVAHLADLRDLEAGHDSSPRRHRARPRAATRLGR